MGRSIPKVYRNYQNASFDPDWVSSPGDTMLRCLRSSGTSREDFAAQLDLNPLVVERLLDGEAPITKKIAQRLSAVLGATPMFWVRREQHYRDGLALGLQRTR